MATTVFELEPRGRSTGNLPKSLPANCANAAVGPELQLALGHGDLLARRHRRHHGTAEHFVRKGIAHHAHIRLLAYLGHRRRRQVAHPILVALLPCQAPDGMK